MYEGNAREVLDKAQQSTSKPKARQRQQAATFVMRAEHPTFFVWRVGETMVIKRFTHHTYYQMNSNHWKQSAGYVHIPL